MNERFYSLPKEKLNEIINAAYEVFSGHSYKKSAVGKIAEEAGISKSLLFYYFRDKKDLYYASEGFLHECLQRGKLNADDIEKGYQKLIAYWRGVYQR